MENNYKTIFKSPFRKTEMTNFLGSQETPNLGPPIKRNNRSPMKHIRHKRSISSSSVNLNGLDPFISTRDHQKAEKNHSFLEFNSIDNESYNVNDDYNDDNENILNLFSVNTPMLKPPNRKQIPVNKSNRNIFHFDTSSNNNNNDEFNSSDISIFSVIPQTISQSSFDFNSYLRAVTSNLKVNKQKSSGSIQRNSKLLDLSKPVKLDILQEKDRETIFNEQIMDDFELDCVVRSSTWESDVESDGELELQQDFGSTINVNFIQKPINQLKHTQIPSLIDPFNKIVVSPKKELGTPGSTIFKVHSDIPEKIVRLKSKSPVSSSSSDDTLNRVSILDNNNHNKRKSTFSIENTIKISEITGKKSKCSPHHHIFVNNLKSAFKPIPKTLLNLIVESSDGSLEDATKYATEINSQNCEGIPVPQKTTELVNIPTNAPSVNGIRKSAIVKGVRAKTGSKKNSKKTHSYEEQMVYDPLVNLNRTPYIHTPTERREALLQATENKKNIMNHTENFKGFYSLHEKQQFYKRNMNSFPLIDENKENSNCLKDTNFDNCGSYKRAKITFQQTQLANTDGKKSVNWSDQLEW